MGRWAQRQRTSGATAPAQMLNAHFDDPNEIVLEYSRPLPAPQPDPADWTAQPSGEEPEDVVPGQPGTITLVFAASVTLDTSVQFSGSNPNYLANQSINIG